MATFESGLKLAVTKAKGTSFWIKKSITSSTILTTATDLTTAATGDLAILDIRLETDATGLNSTVNAFTITKSGDATGAATLVSQATSGLGANVSLSYSGDTHPTTGKTSVLKAGGKLQFQVATSAATGAGVLWVYVQFERVDENADILNG